MPAPRVGTAATPSVGLASVGCAVSEDSEVGDAMGVVDGGGGGVDTEVGVVGGNEVVIVGVIGGDACVGVVDRMGATERVSWVTANPLWLQEDST